MAWDYYPDDTPVKSARLFVIEIENPGQLMSETKYRIREACCGREKTVTHKFIRARQRENLDTKCRECTNEIAREKLQKMRAARDARKVRKGYTNADLRRRKAATEKRRKERQEVKSANGHHWYNPGWPVPPLTLVPSPALHGEQC